MDKLEAFLSKKENLLKFVVFALFILGLKLLATGLTALGFNQLSYNLLTGKGVVMFLSELFYGWDKMIKFFELIGFFYGLVTSNIFVYIALILVLYQRYSWRKDLWPFYACLLYQVIHLIYLLNGEGIYRDSYLFWLYASLLEGVHIFGVVGSIYLLIKYSSKHNLLPMKIAGIAWAVNYGYTYLGVLISSVFDVQYWLLYDVNVYHVFGVFFHASLFYWLLEEYNNTRGEQVKLLNLDE